MVQTGKASAEGILIDDPIRIAVTAVRLIVRTPESPKDEKNDKEEDEGLVQGLHLEAMEMENPEG